MTSILFISLLIPPEPKPERLVMHPALEVSEGYYDLSGDIGGREYQGVVVIRKPTPDVYTVHWVSGTDSTVGIATIEGNRLVVGFASSAGTRGLAVFAIENGGKVLSGYWLALPGDGKRNHEKLTWIRGLVKETPAK